MIRLLPSFRTWKRLALIGMVVGGVVWVLIPDYKGDLEEFRAVVKICDRNGQSLRTSLGRDDVFCDPVPLEQSGKWTAKALIAYEDKRFFRHGGVDTIAIGRATLHNVAKRSVVSGASTLTTLVVKMTEPRRRNLWTKLVEAHHARQLEEHLTKEEILEQFINRAPFGGNVHGIEAASQRYFGKPAQNLSLAESAMMMGLPQSPASLRPDRYLSRAVRRRNHVLWRMLENEFITDVQYQSAIKQTMQIKRQSLPFNAPHFCDYIQQRYPGQGTLETTLDQATQSMAEEVLQSRISELAPHGIHGGAIVVIDVQTGTLRAMVGSPDFWKSQVNGATSRRSPGSTLKPFAYAAAMEQGLFTPASMMADIPTSFAGYRPENYSLEYCGPVSVRRALVQSLNIPALRCVQQVGLTDFVQLLNTLEFSTLDRSAKHYGLGIAVGSCETTLLDLSNAYACLARNGSYLPLRFLGNEPAEKAKRIFSKEAAFMVADILGGEERTMELIGHRADVFLPRVAWKTGTSSGHRDAWAIAYNPAYVVGVWMGNPDGMAADQLIGGHAAAPVAGEIFRQLYPTGDAPWYEQPAGLKLRQVCARSGLVPNPDCPATRTDYYIPRISPVHRCEIHCQDEEIWAPEIQAFLENRGMTESLADQKPLRIESPSPGETFRLLSNIPGIRQEIRLAASTDQEVYWFIDGKLHESGSWPLEKGRHTIACADALGNSDQLRIKVE